MQAVSWTAAITHYPAGGYGGTLIILYRCLYRPKAGTAGQNDCEHTRPASTGRDGLRDRLLGGGEGSNAMSQTDRIAQLESELQEVVNENWQLKQTLGAIVTLSQDRRPPETKKL